MEAAIPSISSLKYEPSTHEVATNQIRIVANNDHEARRLPVNGPVSFNSQFKAPSSLDSYVYNQLIMFQDIKPCVDQKEHRAEKS